MKGIITEMHFNVAESDAEYVKGLQTYGVTSGLFPSLRLAIFNN